MGVGGLRPSLESIYARLIGSIPVPEEDQIFAEGVPPDCSIWLMDLFPKFHAFPQTDEMTMEQFLRILMSSVKKYFENSCARILWVNGDYDNVPKRKLPEQKRRDAASTTVPYPANWVFTHKGVRTDRGELLDVFSPQRLMRTRGMRKSMTEILFAAYRDYPWPRTAFIFWDTSRQHGVRLIHGGIVTRIDSLACQVAEGEVRCVTRIKQVLNEFPGHVDIALFGDADKKSFDYELPITRVVVTTVDADAIPLLLPVIWDDPLADVVLLYAKEKYLNMQKLVARLKYHKWTWQAFMTACSIVGTDYTSKKDTLPGVGFNVAWAGWNLNVRNIPPEAMDKPTELFDIMLRMAYAHKTNQMWNSSWAQIRHKIKGVPETISRACDDYLWLCVYWTSLGERTDWKPGDKVDFKYVEPAPIAAPNQPRADGSIDIRGLSHGSVLKVLCLASKHASLQTIGRTSSFALDENNARILLALRISIVDGILDARNYDADEGPDAAAIAIAILRCTEEPNLGAAPFQEYRWTRVLNSFATGDTSDATLAADLAATDIPVVPALNDNIDDACDRFDDSAIGVEEEKTRPGGRAFHRYLDEGDSKHQDGPAPASETWQQAEERARIARNKAAARSFWVIDDDAAPSLG